MPSLSPVSRTGLVHGAHAPRSTRHSNVEPAWSAVNRSSTSRVAIHGRGSAVMSARGGTASAARAASPVSAATAEAAFGAGSPGTITRQRAVAW